MDSKTSLLARIANLRKMSLSELQDLWQDVYHDKPPKNHKTLLVRKLTYRLQELAHGVDQNIERRIAEYSKQYFQDGKKLQKRTPSYIQPMVGVKLVRHYKGIEYQVTVLEKGYEYQGCLYNNLSKIAIAITGCNWSGPAFFGLQKTKEGKH